MFKHPLLFLGVLAVLAVSVTPGYTAEHYAVSYAFTALDGRQYNSWGLTGTPVVVNVGSHF